MGRGEILDEAFIQSIEHRPKPIIIEDDGIPTIDMSSMTNALAHLSDHNPSRPISKSLAALVTEIGDACEKWGFFQVLNHGIPLDTLEKFEQVARTFFALPSEEKRKVMRDEGNPLGYYDAQHTKNVRDWKEVFDIGVQETTVIPTSPDDAEPKKLVNKWPQYPPEFREVAQEYASEVEKLANKLMQLIAMSLGLPADRFKGFFKDATSSIGVNHYPACPFPHLALGLGRHKDKGGLTILAQDNVGGLQVRRKSDGEWVSVKPAPHAFIINIGDIIQVWSNDKYESVEHRVVANSKKDRMSIAFFLNPSHYVMVKPLEDLVNEKSPAKYREYNWGKLFASRAKSNSKKLNVENIQISHFKIAD